MDQFKRPIPGQSLTDTPKNSPWERPPEIVDVGEVVKFYINKLAKEEVMDDLAVTFELGADLESVVQTMMITGTMKGMHTVEAGMLAGPVVGTFIKSAMSSYGLEVPETMVDPVEARRETGHKRIKHILKEYMGREGIEKDEGFDLVSDMQKAAEQEEPSVEEAPEEPMEEPQTEQPQGLMAKGVEA
jgi:hypothetical protein